MGHHSFRCARQCGAVRPGRSIDVRGFGSVEVRGPEIPLLPGAGIDAMRESRSGEGPLWKVQLSTDASRRFRLQTSRPDLKGAFTVHNDRFDDVELSSDYLEVSFSLSHPDFGDVPDVYVFGGLTGWSLDPDWQMRYDVEKQEYKLTRWMKQGWYDYRYVAVGEGSRHAFEADHAGTPNAYTVFVHAPAPDGTDRVIGMNSQEVK